MKLKPRSFLAHSSFPSMVAICLMAGASAHGALFWDGGNTGGTGDGASAGGSGTWSTGVQNWDAGNAVARVVWTDGNDAVFAGSGGNVTLGTAISAGNISISNNNYTIATDSGALTLSGGITTGGSFYHQIAGAGGLVLSGSQAFNITGGLRISTPVSGSGTITKTGSGFFSFSNSGNSFTGKIVVNEGKFGINGDSALGAVPGSFVADSITLNGGTLVDGIVNGSGGGFDNGGEVTVNANRGVTLGGSGGTVQVGYGASTLFAIAGKITGGGSLTKTDGGTLMLYGASDYSGGTFINGGVLSVGKARGDGDNGSNTSLGTGVVEVGSGAQLVLAGNDLTIANNIILKGNATQETRQGALVGGRQDGGSANVLTGTLTLDGTGDRGISTWWSDKSLELQGQVTGSGNLRVMNVKADGSNGASVVILSNNTNNYSGDTIVDGIGNGAILRLGADNVISDGAGKGNVTVNGRLESNGFTDTINGLSGSGVVAVSAGSTLFVGNNDATSDFSGVFAGSSSSFLRKVGSGTLTLSGASDNTDARARVDAGTLVLAKTNSTNAHAVGSGGGTDYALTITGGTAKLGGTGGDQIYQASAINMTGGTFDLAGLSEGFDGLSGNAGTVTNSTASTTSTLTLGQNNSTGSPVFSGTIENGAGTVALVKTGSGTQTLSGANSYSGGTNLSGGTLAVTNNGALGTGTLNMATGTTLANSDNVAHTLANNIVFGSTATLFANSDLTLNGALSGGSGGLQIAVKGAGVLTISNNGHNLGSGATPAVWTVTDGGTLAMTQGNNLGNLPSSATTQVILDNGTFKTVTANGQFFSSRGMQVNAAGGTWHDSAGGVSIDGAVVNDGPFTVNTSVSNATSTLNGAVSGSGSLIKTGGGTLVLASGSSSYNGVTTVTAGKLIVNGNISTSVTTTVANTGTLGGSGTVGSLIVQTGGTLAPGNSPGILNTGDLDLQSGSTLGIEIDGLVPGTNYDQLNVTGSATLAGLLNVSLSFTPTNGDLFFILLNDSNDAVNGTFSGLADNSEFSVGDQAFKISYFGDSGTSAFTGGNDVVLMAIPEPGAALLGSLGLLALLRRRR